MIVISLTTTSRRLHLCRMTLFSLLTQSKGPDRIFVWVSSEAYLRDDGFSDPTRISHLQRELDELFTKGKVEFHWVENTGPYRKFFAALAHVNDKDIIVTADDDIHYGRNWLKALLDDFNPDEKFLLAARVKLRVKNILGIAKSYVFWPLQGKKTIESANWVCTFGGGAAFCKGWISVPYAENKEYRNLAPTADDLWYSRIFSDLGIPVKVVPESLSALNFVQHNDGLVLSNWPQARSLMAKASNRLVVRPLGYLGFSVSENDSAYKRIEHYFLSQNFSE